MSVRTERYWPRDELCRILVHLAELRRSISSMTCKTAKSQLVCTLEAKHGERNRRDRVIDSIVERWIEPILLLQGLVDLKQVRSA